MPKGVKYKIEKICLKQLSLKIQFGLKCWVNPHTPVAQKTADELVFRRFQGEEVEFFKIGPH